MSKILITGVTGFVGQYLSKSLLKDGHKVFGIGHAESNYLKNKNVKITHVDITHSALLHKYIKKTRPTHIYHLAGIAKPTTMNKRSNAEYFHVNTYGTYNLLHALKEYCPKSRVLVVSTAKVYANSKRKISESSKVAPATDYEASKYLAEIAAQFYAYAFGMNIMVARPVNHIGPKMPQYLAFAEWSAQIASFLMSRRSRALKVGDIGVKREFLDVRDVVGAYQVIMKRGKTGEVYNVSSGAPKALSRYLDIFKKVSGVNFKIQSQMAKKRKHEGSSICCSGQKLQTLGWKRKFSDEDAIKCLLESYIPDSPKGAS